VKSRYLGMIFVAAVIVPSILLAVLSIRAAGREEAFVEKQLTTTLLAEVTQTAGLASAEVGRIVDELRAGIDVPDTGDYARILPRWQRATTLVGVPFLLSPRFGILWPRESSGLDSAQKKFLQRNGDFLSDKAATVVLQNIAVKYQQEILAETRRTERVAEKPAPRAPMKAARADAASAEVQTLSKDEATAGAAADTRATAGAAANTRATAEAQAGASADITSRQLALDAFAQNPALQSKVYEQAREKGDRVSPRVAQPMSKMAQNAAPSFAASEAGAEETELTGTDLVPKEKKETSYADGQVAAAPGAGAAGGAAPASSPVPAHSPTPVPVPAAGAQRVPPGQQSQFVITSRLLSQIASQGDYGLIPRFIGDTLTFLFWERQKDGRIAGCEIAESQLRQRVAGVLSGTYTPVRIITILDESGAPLAVPPDSTAHNWRQPFVSREIGESLPRWEAAGYLTSPDAISARARSSSFVIWIMVLILFVSVAGGGTLVLNSVYGEMRLAQKKATFVTNVSHELKTPLTSISLFVELLRGKRQPDARKREKYLSMMASETERLTRLINNVLDFSASERGGKRYAKKMIDAVRVTEEIVESQRIGLEGRGFTLSLSSDSSDTFVNADPEALKQVLLNLLSNAEKYSPDRKEIEVEVTRMIDAAPRAANPGWSANLCASDASSGRSDVIMLHVRDRGVGVADKDRERVFREFFRVDDSLTSRVRGTGLGLTIARRIVRDHGGDITCAPRTGGGSDFIVRLPAAGGGDGGDRS
jgi:signal transduction histidine kinase